MRDGLKERVRSFWQAEPCGTKTARSAPGTAEFFREVEAARYRLEPFILPFADFRSWQGRDVLEVGVGLGTDFVNFARAGARLSGIDLTPAAVDSVQCRIDLEGLAADIRVADAEALPFEENSFDLVYSWGVIHHTPDPAAAIAEIRRVLRPGGETRVMMYSRRSWVAFGLWARYALLAGRPWRNLRAVVANHMESPGTQAYTTRELEELFADFRIMDIRKFVTPYDRRVAGPLARLTGDSLGWFTAIRAQCP